MQAIFHRFWWQAWIKPFYLVQAPFDRVLWIDADCVVLKPLNINQPIFDEPHLLSRSFARGCTVVDELTSMCPEASIVHFLGPHKLSKQMDRQLHDVLMK
jgi:alpha-N-acetylglucosamine transferase